MTFNELEKLLQETIGLDASTIGSASIHRAVMERMKAIGSPTVENYWNTVCSSATELQELVETVVVPETWFFRDSQAFTSLGKLVREEWLPRNPDGVLRVLSVPCSTGEEAYSLAICLHASGAQRFHIDAVDISHKSLARARQGLFGKNSFRGAELDFQSNYFTRHGNVFELNKAVRSRVHFEQRNLLEDGFAGRREKYEFIFCRNLLIYFDAATQKRAFATLKESLTDTGVLFVGPSEGAVAANYGFASLKLPMSFAFRKAEAAKTSGPKVKPPRTPVVFMPAPRVSKAIAPRAVAPVPKTETATVEINLDHARESADAGRLEEAEKICHAFIQQKGASAEAFYLLGLVQDAHDKKEQAREYYRKALYLQPNHYDALMHLALLTASLGDTNGARVLQQRAERIKQTAK